MKKELHNNIQNLLAVNDHCQNLIMAMVLQSEQKYLLRMELFSSPEKIIPSSGDNINKGNTFVHLTDPLPQSNSVNNY